MRQLDDAKRSGEATALAVVAQHDVPSLAVGPALAHHLRAANDLEGAAQALGFVPLLNSFRPDEWALAREAANLLEACGRPGRALDTWRLLLADKTLPPAFRIHCLRDAGKIALTVQDFAQAIAWEKKPTKSRLRCRKNSGGDGQSSCTVEPGFQWRQDRCS